MGIWTWMPKNYQLNLQIWDFWNETCWLALVNHDTGRTKLCTSTAPAHLATGELREVGRKQHQPQPATSDTFQQYGLDWWVKMCRNAGFLPRIDGFGWLKISWYFLPMSLSTSVNQLEKFRGLAPTKKRCTAEAKEFAHSACRFEVVRSDCKYRDIVIDMSCITKGHNKSQEITLS